MREAVSMVRSNFNNGKHKNSLGKNWEGSKVIKKILFSEVPLAILSRARIAFLYQTPPKYTNPAHGAMEVLFVFG